MSRKTTRWTSLMGAALGTTLFSLGAQAHECHALGQPNNDSIGQYWLCAGFTYEDGVLPRAGTLNNLDILPIWVTSPDSATDVYLDTRKGDTVAIIAELVQVKGAYYDVPHDPLTFELNDQYFFFQTKGIGYSSGFSTSPAYARLFTNLVPVTFIDDGETAIAYRSPSDFITPNAGLYAIYVQGTLKVKGKPPITFAEKFVSSQPRVPWGPVTVTNTSIGDFSGAPEGWFDSVRPANWPTSVAAVAASRAGAPAKRSSPPASLVLRHIARK